MWLSLFYYAAHISYIYIYIFFSVELQRALTIKYIPRI